MYCPNCGAQLTAGANFCANCGAQLNITTTLSPATVVTPAAANPYAAAQGCTVMLLSLGSCTVASASSLIQQLCGYAADEALLIAQSAPVAVAQNLTELQANTLAQALCEYGLEISVYDGSGWRELESPSTSVWSQAGTLIAKAASALGLIGAANRIAKSLMHRWDYPYRYTGSRPPVYRLHNSLTRRTPPPRPAAPKQPAEPRRAPAPARRPERLDAPHASRPQGPGQGGPQGGGRTQGGGQPHGAGRDSRPGGGPKREPR